MGNTNEKGKFDVEILRLLLGWVYRLRSIILSIPVAVAAVIIALNNNTRLPDTVGFNMQASGEYAIEVAKSVAVLGPVAITALCLLMIFCSKRC